MKKEDTAIVQDVAVKSWNATYEGIIPAETQENFLNTAYSDEMMERRLNNSLLLVAEAEHNIVGFANYSPVNNKGKAELGAIYIYPEYQGAGIGTALLQEGIKHLNDVKEIYINVERENKIGKNFYEAKGFVAIDEFDDDFDGHILKTVRMVLKL
ncbi:GNAT family N-acetyltransferase [Ralstonia pickettii]|nr:GNAT family N-acetyltransferase [Ralstonia pickettii]